MMNWRMKVDSISDFVSQAEQIATLKEELKAARYAQSQYKFRYEAIVADRLAIRKKMANELIKARINGDRSLSIEQIAERCFFTVSTIYKMTCRLKQEAQYQLVA